MSPYFISYNDFEFNFKFFVTFNSRKEFEESLSTINQEFLKLVSKFREVLPNVTVQINGPKFIKEK